MKQRKKLDLKELELQLPSIDLNETRIILGGNDYGDNLIGHMEDGDFVWYTDGGTNNGGNNNVGGNNATGDNIDAGDLDHYYDEDNAGDWDQEYADGRHEGEFRDLPNGGKEYMLQDLPSIEVQDALNCWMEAAEFLYEFFDKDGVVTDTEIENYNNDVMQWFQSEYNVQHSWEALLRGLDVGEHTDHFMDHFFENEKLSDILQLVEALNDGHPVYAAVDSIHDDSQGDRSTDHAVVIVGYEIDQDGNFVFICADSATGAIEYYPADHIDYSGVYEIFGRK